MFSKLLTGDSWDEVLADAVTLDAEQGIAFIEAARSLIIRTSADYERRVIAKLQEFKYQLLWLGGSHPYRECPQRKIVADMILAADSRVDQNGQKMYTDFNEELTHVAADNGKMTRALELWCWMRSLAREWRGDTTEIEGGNSLIKIEVAKAPHISLALLSARFNTTKSCGLGSKGSSMKWSEVQSTVEDLKERAVSSFIDAESIMDIPQRWQALTDTEIAMYNPPLPPLPLPSGLPAPAAPAASATALAAKALARAAVENWNKWMKARAAQDGDSKLHVLRYFVAFSDSEAALPVEAWLCPLTFLGVGHFLRCRLGASLEVLTPFQFKSSSDVFEAAILENELPAEDAYLPIRTGTVLWGREAAVGEVESVLQEQWSLVAERPVRTQRLHEDEHDEDRDGIDEDPEEAPVLNQKEREALTAYDGAELVAASGSTGMLPAFSDDPELAVMDFRVEANSAGEVRVRVIIRVR